jgi:hypothetical protein
MSFKSWIEKADKELSECIKEDIHNKSIWKSNVHKNMLLPYYLQYKTISITWWLALATWVLVGATILLIKFG